MKMSLILLIVLLGFVDSSYGAITTTSFGTLNKLFVYDDFGAVNGVEGADVAVWFDTGLAECSAGVWLSPSQPGYKMLSSSLLAAYMSKSKVRFQVYNDEIWTGSGSNLCKIDALRFE
ncbi:hypothetical protein FM037_24670 [Shewanella psychropiezotolerans]|uniref:Uncharacterized protein n=1 Tax=Shewanella psychropiezotolerans TaxID=2593655 RepID=A0ABX5X616_9GAMM|nr:hypothetical protein [Shewanella psychropiezotolerans]QDO85867.1 hypothetical protein FM037_24670 [Shewanella psychropiezotolerans]